MTKKPRTVKRPDVRHGHLKFRSRGPFKCFLDSDGKSLRGVHKFIQQTVMHGANVHKVATRESDPPTPDFHFRPTQPPRVTANRRRGAPIKAGSKVDTQVEKVLQLRASLPRVRLLHDTEPEPMPLALLYHCRSRAAVDYTRAACLTEAQLTAVRNLRRQLLTETCSLLECMDARQWVPLSAQTAVQLGKIGTACDIVIMDCKVNKVRVLEVKTGYTKYKTNGKHMAAPYSTHLVSNYNEALVQALLSHLAYCRHHPTRPVDDPYLVVVNQNGVHGYLPPDWVVEGASQLVGRAH